ncbi:MAG: type IV pilus biogenesis/stability protein PilW [Promethearchaeota archaeon]
MFRPETKELIQVNQLLEEGKVKEAFHVILELEKRGDLSPKELLLYKLVKANLLRGLGKFLDAIEIAKEIYQEFQKLGDLLSSLDALLIQAYSYLIMANITQSEDIIRQAEILFKVIKETLSINLRERESLLVRIKAGIYHFKGDIHTSLELNKKAYELAKDTGSKPLISASLNNIADQYYHMKEYDKAIKYAKKALKVNPSLPVGLASLIYIYNSKGNIKEAKVYLEQLRSLFKKLDDEISKTWYYSSKALILKSSLRARDRIKAEEIFKMLAMDDTLFGEARITAIIELCDLYLIELRITNDLEIINEIQPFVQKLLDIAEDQHLYIYLAETYFLQAKLSLLTLDIKEAKRFLTQAQNVAEIYGLKRLAANISNEHDKLLNQEKIWENFEQSEISLSERLELAGLNEQIDYIIKRRIIEDPKLTDEQPVLLLIVSEGGIPFFSHSFNKDKAFEDHLFGGFFTAINSFIHEMFSEGLDRASFGKHTLLMDSVSPFLMCYVYKGQSYLAQKRMKSFINMLKSHSEVWDTFEEFYHANRKIKITDIPTLEPIITEIFIKKTGPPA